MIQEKKNVLIKDLISLGKNGWSTWNISRSRDYMSEDKNYKKKRNIKIILFVGLVIGVIH